MASPDPILDFKDVRFGWPERTSFSLAVEAMSLAAGETLLLLGESGSGKSTLLSLICGTIAPQTGRIRVAGTDLTALSGAARDRFRAEQIGVIFQQFNLLPFGSVADNKGDADRAVPFSDVDAEIKFPSNCILRSSEFRSESQSMNGNS